MTDTEKDISSSVEPVVDHRSPDQETAMVEAFVAGTLPEEERRHAAMDDVGEETPEPTDADVFASAGVGSVFTKEANGWRASYVLPSGATIYISGPTLIDALAVHGLQVTHDGNGVAHADRTGPQHRTLVGV